MESVEKIVEGNGCFFDYTVQPYRRLGRVICGFSWPMGSAGFAVVLGEDLLETPMIKQKYVHLIDEYEEANLSKFLNRLCEFQFMYKVQRFSTDTEYAPSMNFFRKSEYKKRIKITQAPFLEDGFENYLYMIQARLDKDVKTLELGKNSKVRSYLSALQPEQIPNAKPYQHAAIRALGYALATLETHKHLTPSRMGARESDRKRATDYDPLGRNK